MAAPLILIEAQPRRSSDGSSVTVRLAGGGGELPYFYEGQHWRAGVVQLPTIVSSIGFAGDNGEAGEFGSGGVPQAAEIQWAPSSMALLAEIASHFWTDAPVSIFIGPETGGKPPLAIAGKALSGNVDGGVLTIAMSDPVADLKKPLLTERYGGTGDLDGPVDWAGKIKDRVWGRVWNKAGEPIDKANNIYCFADPLRPIDGFSAARDRGAAGSGLTLLAWQGSAEATLTALRAAVPPAGGGVACPSICCIKWWTTPGDLTADLRGEIGTGYVETTAQIVERIVQAGANLPFAAGTVAAAAAARPAPVGWVARDDSTSQAEMIEALLGNSSLLWLLDETGQIVLRPWAWGASVASVRSAEVSRTKTLRPVATRELGYRRNEHVVPRSALAGIVLAEDTVFGDGTTLEDLKPAEPGATAGAPSGTNIGDRPVDDVLVAIDNAAEALEGIEGSISELFESLGDAESAATNAALAQAAKEAAETAQTAAEGAASASAGSASAALIAQGGAEDAASIASAARVDALAAKTDATSAANTAQGHATAAGNSATAANTAKLAAEAAAGGASSSATVATNQAVIATDAAAAAQTSQVLAAAVGSNSLNGDPVFARWPSGSTWPTAWTSWYGLEGVVTKVPGHYGNAVQIASTAPYSAAGQGMWTGPDAENPGMLASGPGYYVIACEVELVSGSLVGAGMRLQGYDAGGAYVSGSTQTLIFWSEPDSTGAAPGAGVVGKTYTFSKLVRQTAAVDRNRLVCSNHAEAFGAATSKTLRWHKATCRPATQEEIARQTVLAPLEAQVSTQAGVIAEHAGKLAAYWKVNAVAGGRAQLAVWADANGGGGIDIVGDTRIDGDLLVSGSIKTARLALNAATDTVFADFKGANTGGIGSYQPIVSQTVAIADANTKLVLLLGGVLSALVTASTGTITNIRLWIRLTRNGTVIRSGFALIDRTGTAAGPLASMYEYQPFSIITADSPGVGSWTYALEVQVTQTGGTGTVGGIANAIDGVFAPIMLKR